MSESCGIYGLPRKLINFLRQMEKYRDTLKWNINEGSHKLSLTMTWTMNKDRLSFVDRMKKTFGLNHTWAGQGIEVPKRVGSFRKKGQRSSSETRCPFCNKVLPPDKRGPESPWSSPWNLTRNSSLNKSSRGSPFNSPTRDANFNRSLSLRDSNFNSHFNRSSWSEPRSPCRTSTPKRDGLCNSVTSESPDQHSCTSSTKSVRLSYRTVEDIEISYEDLFQKAKEETSRQLDSIKKDWNRSIRISSRSQYSSSSSSSTDDVINENLDGDVTHENGDLNGIPSEPLAPAPPVGDQRPGTSFEGRSSNHSNRSNNDLSMVQRATIERNNLRGPYKRLSYSTDIL